MAKPESNAVSHPALISLTIAIAVIVVAIPFMPELVTSQVIPGMGVAPVEQFHGEVLFSYIGLGVIGFLLPYFMLKSKEGSNS